MPRSLCIAAALLSVLASAAMADVAPGTSFDFESGTTEGWGGGASPVNVATGGPSGADDAFLQVGNGGRWAVHNTGLSGVLDPTVDSIRVDLRRPTGESDFEMRLVLFGPGSGFGAERWTSTNSVTIPGDGSWNTYTFSLLGEDLTRVQGASDYADLIADIDRIMFRYDTGTPSAGGESVTGTLGLDNIFVIGATGDLFSDFNGDGVVDLLDLDILGSNFGGPGDASSGDANGDNVVDLLDLDILGQEFGSGAAAEALPEPTTGLLAAVVIAGVAIRRRR